MTLTRNDLVSGNMSHDTSAAIEAARRRHRRRIRRRVAAVTGAAIVLATVVTVTSLRAGSGVPRTRQGSRLAGGIAGLAGEHLDVFWSPAIGEGSPVNLTVNLGTGDVRRLAPVHATTVLAISRKGYLFGYGGGGESVTDDLGRTLASDPDVAGLYPAPAADPSDIWLTDLGSSSATEVGPRLRPTGPAVALPPSNIVVGQSASNLLLVGPAPAQRLVLWDPTSDHRIAVLGSLSSALVEPVEQGNVIAWAEPRGVAVGDDQGHLERSIAAPAGHVAASLAISPDDTRLAIEWQGGPGNAPPVSSSVAVVSIATGRSHTMEGAIASRGLLAWTHDSRHLIFPVPAGTSTMRFVSVAVGSGHLTPVARGVVLPSDVSAGSGSIVAWSSRP